MGELAELSEALMMRVQEIAKNGAEIPPAFHCRDDQGREIVPPTESPVPVINFSLLSPSLSKTEEGQKELEKLKTACSTWGCFVARGHGIPFDYQTKLIKTCREFFAQPMEEKIKHPKTLESVQGYGGDPLPTEEGMKVDWFDRLVITTFPEEMREYKFWPTKPTSIREVIIDYCLKMKVLANDLNKAMARSLGLEDEDCFAKQFGGDKERMDTSWNLYPACPKPELILGLRPHNDASGYSILAQDDLGLQVEKDGKWYAVPHFHDALTIVLGDQMEIMTNGIFKSVEHRVVVNPKNDRVAVVVGYIPDVEKEIGPVEGLTKDGGAKYKTVTNYVDMYYNQFVTTTKALDLLRI
ncbi:hypothetical protein Leryth_024082 [Lithospermum erythrorhizon]|nr:hypothetical protein Leryth_024082 [Lithospermum erythrorhizon]